MSERHGAGHGLTDHELSEIRMLIEERTGIHFDESRERFLSTRVREHMHERGYTRVTELLRAVRKTNVEYDSLLERMLTQETSFFPVSGGLRSVRETGFAGDPRIEILEEPADAAGVERGLLHGRRALFHCHYDCGFPFVCGRVERGDSRD